MLDSDSSIYHVVIVVIVLLVVLVVVVEVVVVVVLPVIVVVVMVVTVFKRNSGKYRLPTEQTRVLNLVRSFVFFNMLLLL